MDAPANMQELADVGAKAAETQVKGDHLPGGFRPRRLNAGSER
jgi:hypothetical protein